MISLYKLKPAFQNILRPATDFLARHHITPNMVTVTAIVCSLVMGALIAVYPHHRNVLWGVPVLLFVRMALNAIDGMLARNYNMQSKLGMLLNEAGDIVSDVALYLPFALIPIFDPKLIVMIVILSIMTETIGIIGCQIGASRRYDGPCGKSDRAFIFGAFAIVLALDLNIKPYLVIIQWVIIAALLLTLYNRAIHALKECQ